MHCNLKFWNYKVNNYDCNIMLNFRLAALQKNSPFSLKVTFEQMKRGKSLDLKQSLELEYAISQNFMVYILSFFLKKKTLFLF